ncbi:uncharacterized protein LOC127365358 [Dicentrarchus labrax]|uniref:uncharacterized protein LOC127365358 n=1 Tax=Dicentrarchus labrax TaxID=13489 RepID=UPI0021F668BF|nr:uncharacterized protein LOC127365358 [Dicentrarchus labrax]XP_051259347.1 uncharacterized protein LOC127365358 [Dicentrarchus labrax]XP_051259348.1 uncharacterized protein LOC127365358 [Dicentrarchus labrax]XP_051259349.1 uncharacterized protein LOC127365358 [Dicentrarchus labrax]XP_051259350.1 uncharacterized protein LOC127365358 [Dicentrarchus labrax]
MADYPESWRLWNLYDQARQQGSYGHPWQAPDGTGGMGLLPQADQQYHQPLAGPSRYPPEVNPPGGAGPPLPSQRRMVRPGSALSPLPPPRDYQVSIILSPTETDYTPTTPRHTPTPPLVFGPQAEVPSSSTTALGSENPQQTPGPSYLKPRYTKPDFGTKIPYEIAPISDDEDTTESSSVEEKEHPTPDQITGAKLADMDMCEFQAYVQRYPWTRERVTDMRRREMKSRVSKRFRERKKEKLSSLAWENHKLKNELAQQKELVAHKSRMIEKLVQMYMRATDNDPV